MKRILAFMILLLLLQSATACAASDPFAHSTDLFFEHFLRQNANAAIESLDAYHYDGVTYYHVSFREPDTEEVIELVYYGDRVSVHLNPNWQNFGDLLDEYAHFRVAEREGEHKEFSVAEIETYRARNSGID